MLELIKVHDSDLSTDIKEDIKDQCVKLLNDEWPRSELLRLRTLNASKDYFPMSLALVKKPENIVIGHVKLSEIPSKLDAIWIESVVIHPDLRGKGVGKHLMFKTEEFCRRNGYKLAYLCTIDRQIFYSRCGYKFCKPVTASSGTVGIRHGKNHLEILLERNDKNLDEDLVAPPNSELGQICAQVFQAKPEVPQQDPIIKLPLKPLKINGIKSVNSGVCCKAGVHKDFMKKWL